MGIINNISGDLEREAARLFSNLHSSLMAEAEALCGDRAAAEDLVMQTIERLCSADCRYDEEKGGIFPYARKVLKNEYLKSIRGKMRKAVVYIDPDELAIISDERAENLQGVEAASEENSETVRVAIASLSPEMREIIMLRHFDECTIPKIARILGLSENSVRCRLHYARKVLAKRLSRLRKPKALSVLAAAFLAVISFAAVKTGVLSFAAGGDAPVLDGGLSPSGDVALAQGDGPAAADAAPLAADAAVSNAGISIEQQEGQNMDTNIRTMVIAAASLAASLAAAPILATTPAAAESSYPLEGGTRSFVETGDGFDVVNTFTESGTLTVASETTVRALFVAGGGGGGCGVGGGGGGGGVVALDELVLAPGTYTVTVGAGGNGGTKNVPYGTNGGNTTLTLGGADVSESLPAIGGGRGTGWNSNQGHSSGGSGGASCGGKAGAAGTPGQGYAGGTSGSRSSGGGGGAGGPGGNGGTGAAGIQKPASAVGGAGFVSDISGSSVAYGGGGGGGGGDGGACPGSSGTDGGGDGTGLNAITAAGNGEDGRGGGGGGSGWSSDSSPKDGGHGGSGVVILRYSFDPSMLAEPTVRLGDAVADIASAKIDFNVVSFGRDASSLTILLTATPMAGGAVVSGEFPVIGTGISSCVLRGLKANVAYDITAVATNDRDASSALDVGTIVPYNRSVSATGGDKVFENNHRRIHVFTQSGTFEVTQSGFVDILVVGGGGSGGTGVGGGGGGGGVVWKKGVALAVGSHDVSVGAGGIPADYVSDLETPNGTNGGNSSLDEIVAYGGGAGASWAKKSGAAGGSGGGACGGGAGASGIEGQGCAGGASGQRSSSGGGGAGGPGGDGGTGGNGVQKPASAVGGAGLACDITGETVRYGGGGGGGGGDGGACPGSSGTDGGGDGTDYNGGAGGDGLDGLGAGGGGSGYALPTANSKPGGRGGSGVVIVAYDLPPTGFVYIIR